jgi:hypothetical protein
MYSNRGAVASGLGSFLQRDEAVIENLIDSRRLGGCQI